ncbi:MAG: mechanosensitive ion channel [Deltaproteobacteria bacterium]|nr:mechanosensitive ion channel [Deltaproteobacteria bacterium]
MNQNAFPPPQVLFLGFGESSIDFELRAWTKDADYRPKARSELHQLIDRRLREQRSRLPFPNGICTYAVWMNRSF